MTLVKGWPQSPLEWVILLSIALSVFCLLSLLTINFVNKRRRAGKTVRAKAVRLAKLVSSVPFDDAGVGDISINLSAFVAFLIALAAFASWLAAFASVLL